MDVLGGASHMPGTPAALIVGFVTAGLCGYAAIWGLLRFVKTHSLYWFAAYTGVLGTVMLLSATVFGRG
jgi:undecaprenyl-diphosphatase